MRKLLKYWQDNKQKILITIGVIVLIFICIRVANEIVKQQNEAEIENIQNTFTAQDITKPEESIMTEVTLNETEKEENSQIIANFVELCNKKQIEEAYNLLSNSCKEELYRDVDTFSNNYINSIFSSSKEYSLELWSSFEGLDTYQITYYEGNLLQTGGNISNNNYIDYITVIEQDNTKKINIGKLINKEIINKIAEDQGISITVQTRSIYMDYEIYRITVKNTTENTILLNDGTATNIVLLDESDNEYASLVYEVPSSTLTLEPGYQKTFDLKFNKIYNANSQIRYMEIRDIYLNKEQYDSMQNQEGLEKTTIQIKL